jgi:putative sterol carrier protein
VVAYLSDEWMDEAAAALAVNERLAAATAGTELTIAYEVSGAPGGKVAYGIHLDHGTTTLLRKAPAGAPVTFTVDYDTAVDIARGETPVQVAFMQGRLKLGGDVTLLIEQGGALDGLDDALSELRDRTEY